MAVVTQFTVLNSITNNLDDTKFDTTTPFSFLEFLNQAKVFDQTTTNISQYSVYLKQWEESTAISLTSIKSDVQSQFINFLSEIKLKFTNAEEKRFLSLLDLTKEEDLEISIPFYSRKIKEICLYFSNKRKTIQQEVTSTKDKGTKNSVFANIRSSLIDIFSNKDDIFSVSPILSAITSNIEFEIERTYDVFNDYYDLDPTKEPEYYSAEGQRNDYFTSNTNTLCSVFFKAEDDIIRTLIKEKMFSIEEIRGLLINVSSTDLSNLDVSDTINLRSPERSNLKYLTEIELYKNYLGTDMYYVSTNSTGVALTGNLFTTNNPYRNLLNIHFPSTLTLPNSSYISEREVGTFFRPTDQGVIRLSSKFSFTVKDLPANSFYIFPDPSKYSVKDSALTYVIDPDSVYHGNSSPFAKVYPKVTNQQQSFTSYSSKEQAQLVHNKKLTGISKFTSKGDLYYKATDIFGNVFVSFASDNYFYSNVDPSIEFIGAVPAQEALTDTETLYTTYNSQEKRSISSKQFEPKQYFTIDILTQNIQPLTASFADVFGKYEPNIELYSQILSSIADFAVFSDVFYIRTQNYVVIDKFKYSEEFISTGNIPFITRFDPLTSVGSNISMMTSPVIVDDSIYIANISTADSHLTEKYLKVSIHKYNIQTSKVSILIDDQVVSDSFFRENFTILGIPTNITSIRQSVLTHSSLTNLFSILTNFVDLNYTPIIHSLVFKLVNGAVDIKVNKMALVENESITSNMHLSGAENQWFTQTIDSTPEVNNYYGIFIL